MRKLIFGSSLLLILAVVVSGDSFGGAGAAGTTVTTAAPYVTIGGTKYVMETGFPFTAFPACSSLDAQTATLTANPNGSETITYTGTSTNFWCSVAAATSVETEFRGVGTNNSNSLSIIAGVWMCDSTNGKVYSLDANSNVVGGQNAFIIEFISWTLAACSGTPSAAVGITTAQELFAGTQHFKLVKTGGNLQAFVSLSGGDGYTQIGASQAVGTLSKGGVVIRTGASATTSVVTFLSTPII